MSFVTLQLDVQKAKDLIEQLPLFEKIQLVRELEKETWAKSIDNLLKTIDERRKRQRISSQRIDQEIEKARREFYARRS